MEWLYYLLEANLYLVLFYGFYRLFLQDETFYNINRNFLLCATVISFTLPILQLGLLKPSIEQVHSDYLFITESTLPVQMAPQNTENAVIEHESINFMYLIYLIVAFGFALKLSFSIYKVIKIWTKGKKYTAGDVTLIEVNGDSSAFSFFNLLFIHPSLANQPAVLKHEMVHIKQNHSFDVVFFELVQIICWFNPILYFIKKDIKLLHEYIADELTANAGMQKHEYALFLIQNSFGASAQPITNQIFNQSILKRRINMLNKKRTASWARLRLLLALPLTGAMLCTSTMAFTKDYGYVDLLPEKSNIALPIQDNPKVENIKRNSTPKTTDVKRNTQVKFPPPIVKKDKSGKTPPPPIEPPPSNKKLVKFPPPIVSPDKTRQDGFLANHSYKNNSIQTLDNRYILINGAPVSDKSTFYGVFKTESVTILSPAAAIKKYGNKDGKNGAVEITGNNIQYLDRIPLPPMFDEFTLNRSTGQLFKLDYEEDAQKSLTVTNNKGKVVYNDTDYLSTWDGKKSNYGETSGQKLAPGIYSYIVKVVDKPTASKRGKLVIKGE
jgi:hypothetical protein